MSREYYSFYVNGIKEQVWDIQKDNKIAFVLSRLNDAFEYCIRCNRKYNTIEGITDDIKKIILNLEAILDNNFAKILCITLPQKQDIIENIYKYKTISIQQAIILLYMKKKKYKKCIDYCNKLLKKIEYAKRK